MISVNNSSEYGEWEPAPTQGVDQDRRMLSPTLLGAAAAKGLSLGAARSHFACQRSKGGWNPAIQGLFPGRGWDGHKMLPPLETASQLSGKNSCVAFLQRGEPSVQWGVRQDMTENKDSLGGSLRRGRQGSKAGPASWLCDLGQSTSPL